MYVNNFLFVVVIMFWSISLYINTVLHWMRNLIIQLCWMSPKPVWKNAGVLCISDSQTFGLRTTLHSLTFWRAAKNFGLRGLYLSIFTISKLKLRNQKLYIWLGGYPESILEILSSPQTALGKPVLYIIKLINQFLLRSQTGIALYN